MTETPFQKRLAELRAQRQALQPQAPPAFQHPEEALVTFDDEDYASPEQRELDDILSRVDILEAYDRWCGKMKPNSQGKTEGIMISCPNPAHADRNPSAWINTDKQTYFCGGCQEGGDKFTIAEFRFNTGYTTDPEQFVALKKMMALDLGWVIKTTPAGNAVAQQVVQEEEEDEPTEPAVPELAPVVSLHPSSVPDPDPQQAPAEVVELPGGFVEPIFPSIDWRNIVPGDTFLDKWMNVATQDDLPEEYYFWLGLMMVGEAIGRDAMLNDGPPVKGNLFVCLLGKTGGGKSRATSLAMDLLRTALPYDHSDPATKGVMIVPSPGSAEALIDTFSKPVPDPTNPKHVAYYAPVRGMLRFDELSSLVGRSSRTGSVLKPTLMEFYDGAATVEIRSRTHGHVKAEYPFCSSITTTQPKAIKELLTAQDADSGFINRWVFATGRKKQTTAIRTVTQDISGCVQPLQHIRSWTGPSRMLHLEGIALKKWSDFFYDELNPTMESDESGLYTRLDLTIKKVMLLLAANAHSEITGEIVDQAISLYAYLLESYQFLSGRIGLGKFEDAHRTILEGVERWQKRMPKKLLPMRDLVRFAAPLKYQSDMLVKVIQTMVAIGELDEVVVKGSRGPQTVKYKLAE